MMIQAQITGVALRHRVACQGASKAVLEGDDDDAHAALTWVAKSCACCSNACAKAGVWWRTRPRTASDGE